ncbi:serine/threonine-protein kinase ULK3, partial [Aphelenchoides avenae]
MKEAGVIHRDLKPENILLCKNQRSIESPRPWEYTIKLADFGVAFIAEASGSWTSVYGTEAYIAPEIFRIVHTMRQGIPQWNWRNLLPLRNESKTPQFSIKCDMFSVGVVAYECVTGRLPFKRTNTGVPLFGLSTERVNAVADGLPYEPLTNCGAELQQLIAGLLVPEPEARLGPEEFALHPFFRTGNHKYGITALSSVDNVICNYVRDQ